MERLMQQTQTPSIANNTYAWVAFWLRIGLGSVFIIGGIAKLERLLNPDKAFGIVTEYVGPLGYINETFMKWLFSGNFPAWFTPWSFLTTLSAFELISGMMLVAGLLIRPLAVFWALLLWSFIFSLPVVTTPGIALTSPTYTSPAMFVQVRDIALSGFFFVLYFIGAGKYSVDANFFKLPASQLQAWDNAGLLLRASLAVVLLIGGLFHGYGKIMSFGMPALLLNILGLGVIAGGVLTRFSAACICALLLWYLASKLGDAKSVIGYFNSVKREFGLLSAAGIVSVLGGGQYFAIQNSWKSLRNTMNIYTRRNVTNGA